MYEVTGTNLSAENVISENEYSINITIGLHPLDDFTPDFSKNITVISNNNQTGFEVDAQREAAINDFINSINQ